MCSTVVAQLQHGRDSVVTPEDAPGGGEDAKVKESKELKAKLQELGAILQDNSDAPVGRTLFTSGREKEKGRGKQGNGRVRAMSAALGSGPSENFALDSSIARMPILSVLCVAGPSLPICAAVRKLLLLFI